MCIHTFQLALGNIIMNHESKSRNQPHLYHDSSMLMPLRLISLLLFLITWSFVPDKSRPARLK